MVRVLIRLPSRVWITGRMMISRVRVRRLGIWRAMLRWIAAGLVKPGRRLAA
jgi:hypothetical protein